DTYQRFMGEQVDQVRDFVATLDKSMDGGTIKEMAAWIKNQETKIANKLSAQVKDDAVTFEELGVDQLFVDESHKYKNLFYFTKLPGNVRGLGNKQGSQIAMDAYMKVRYLS